MSTSISSRQNLLAFGCLNALSRPVWNLFYKKQMFAGSFSILTASCLEARAHGARFMHLVIRQSGRPRLRATAIPAGRSGARTEAILVTLRTGSFIVTSDSIFQENIWGQLAATSGNFQE